MLLAVLILLACVAFAVFATLIYLQKITAALNSLIDLARFLVIGSDDAER